ncbi:hypothetical protein G4B88_013361 [Cannabis sativa]|uniref:Uncharacterized protein n=1 Tax=Cannabis sativa TaxID=3483 RepID=A0A7J6E2I6_CANSA|nr:hypothetical protein G4B88_013361 [Cannabis sativa]
MKRASTEEVVVLIHRTLSLGLGGVALGLNGGEWSARAAARRPPPSPQEEKKDPNLSGLQAKVVASKKRKEAMKEEMAKLRQRGKSVQATPAQAQPQPQTEPQSQPQPQEQSQSQALDEPQPPSQSE